MSNETLVKLALETQLQNPRNFNFIMDTMVKVMEKKIKYESCLTFVNESITINFLLANFKLRKHETFSCLFLDSGNRLLKYEELFNGTINQALVYPRIVAQKALELNASAVIFAHNHPSGNVEPSESDKAITSKLIEVLKLIDVRVLDHVIVGHSKTFSMSANGMIYNG